MQNISEQTSKEEKIPESYEEKANFFSRILFLWLNPLLNLGYRRTLNANDLPELSSCDKSSEIYNAIDRKWVQTKKTKASLFKSMVGAFGLPFFCAAFLKLIHDICQFIGPIMLEKIILFLENEDPSVPKSVGYSYGAIMFFAALLQSLCLRNYFFLCFRTGLRLRSSCVTMVYNKSLRLSAASRVKYSQGEIMNLMEVDSQKFQDITSYLQTIWSGPFQIIGSLILLWRQLGPATLSGVVVMIVMIPFTKFISKKLGLIQRELMKVKDRRINTTSEAFEGMKLIKLQAWEKSFLQRITGIRSEEIKVLRKAVWMRTFSSTVWNATPYLVSILSFLVYVLLGNSLTTSVAFTSMTLLVCVLSLIHRFNILRFPLTQFPETINNLSEGQVSVQRVERFLNADEVEIPSRYNRENVGITVVNGDFMWSEPPSQQKKTATPSEKKGCGHKAKLQPDVSKEEEEDKYVPFELREVNLSMEVNSVTAIVGHVGCGKSSVINMILGEMQKIDTSRRIDDMIYIRGSIGYVPQTPFILNESLKDNILFGKEFNAIRYQQVLEACCLLPDISILPAGDETEIGEKGINLSGGQKTRVSLARAVYQDCDIYLLDDPLSAVDSHVGRHIFRHCIRGLLRSKCVVLVTHALEYLPVCDSVVVMEKGRVEDQGTYAKVCIRSRGVLEGLLAAQQEAKAQDVKEEEMSPLSALSPIPECEDVDVEKTSSVEKGTVADVETGEKETDKKEGEKMADVKTGEKVTDKKEEEKVTDKKEEEKVTDKKEGSLIQQEGRVKGNVNRSIYRLYFSAAGGLTIISLVLLAYLVTEICKVMNSWWVTYWSNDKAQKPDLWYVSIYACLGITSVILMAVRMIVLYYTGLRASSRLHDGLLNGVMFSPMSFFDQTPLGRITNRISKDIYAVDKTLPDVFGSFLSCLFSICATLFVIIIATPWFVVILLFLSIYYIYEQRFYVKSSREIKRLDSISRSPIYANFGETLDGIPVIRAYEAQNQFVEKNYRLLDLNQRAFFIISSANCWLGIRLEFAGTVIIGAAVMLAVLSKDPQNISFTAMAALAISYSLDTTQSLNWVVRQATDMETQIVAVERIQEYTVLPSEAASHIPATTPVPEWPQHGDVSIKDLVMRYRPELEPVLKNVTVHMHAGEKVGVVGRTGAGKSSLVLCLMRIIEMEHGSIVIDGVDISTIGLTDLRSRIAIIPQEPLLFSGTIRDNLDPFTQYSDEEIWSSLERARMHDVILENPAGLDTVVDEHGSNYSVGQRQLLCVARALLRKSRLILMDEATASIDLETDMKIQKTIREEFKNSTVITIAHRIHTIIDSDKVLVLEMGEVKEFDQPAKLLSNRNSLFSLLVEKSKEIE